MSKILTRSILAGSVGLVEVATYGSNPSSSDPIAWVHASEFSVQEVVDTTAIETLAGPGSGGEGARFVTLVRAQGTVRVPISYEDVGAWIEWAFGKDVATSGSGPYTHVYATSPNTPFRTLVFVYTAADGTNLQDEFYGCQVETAVFEFTANGPAYMTLTVSGGVASRSSTYQTGVAATETPAATSLVTSGVVLGSQGGALSFNSNNVEARTATLTLSRTLDRSTSFGAGGPDEGVLGSPITATLAVERVADEADTATLRTAFTAGTRAALSLAFTSGTKSLTIAFTTASITERNSGATPGAAKTESLTFSAQSLTTSDQIKITVVNSQSSGTPTNGTWA